MNSLTYQTLKISKAASNDETRYNLTAIEVSDRAVVATDGHCLAARKRNADNDMIQNGLYKIGKIASETKKRGIEPFEKENCFGLNGTKIERLDGELPDWSQLEPKGNIQRKVTLNLKLLNKIFDAIGESSKVGDEITLHISDRETDPIFITTRDYDAVGLIMPLRDDKRHDALDIFRALKPNRK